MNLIVIVVLAIILILVVCLFALLIWLFIKHRISVINGFVVNFNDNFQSSKLKAISSQELPVEFETEEDIFYHYKAVVGTYDKSEYIINEKNFDLTRLLKGSKWQIFYRYKIINLASCKFVVLNKIDLLVTKNHLYLYHPLEPITIKLQQIKSVTVFWEKNPLLQKKDFFPGVAFKNDTNSYFLLFQDIREVVKFLTSLNLIYLL